MALDERTHLEQEKLKDDFEGMRDMQRTIKAVAATIQSSSQCRKQLNVVGVRATMTSTVSQSDDSLGRGVAL